MPEFILIIIIIIIIITWPSSGDWVGCNNFLLMVHCTDITAVSNDQSLRDEGTSFVFKLMLKPVAEVK